MLKPFALYRFAKPVKKNGEKKAGDDPLPILKMGVLK